MAVTLTTSDLEAALSINATLAARLLETSTALVERYAPGAPPAVQNEAVIRTAGWLMETPSGGIRSESVGDIRTGYDASRSLGALRHSGAMGLLTTWRVRRAGAI